MNNLWHWMRSHHLSNRVYRDTQHLHDEGLRAFQTLTMSRIRSVCRTPYMERAK